MDPETIRKRLKFGMTIEDALFKTDKAHGLRPGGKSARGVEAITYQGETRSLAEWAKHTGLPYNTLRFRIDHDWDVEAALTMPVQQDRLIEYQGEQRTLKGWAETLEIPYMTVHQRFKKGLPLEKVFEKRAAVKAEFPQLEAITVGTIRTRNGREMAILAWDGKELTLQQWAEELNLTIGALRFRLRENLPLEQVFADARRRH